MTRGASAGMALEALTALPGPTTGPYHAVFASTAKANASRHKPQVRAVRQKLAEVVLRRSIQVQSIMRVLRAAEPLSAGVHLAACSEANLRTLLERRRRTQIVNGSQSICRKSGCGEAGFERTGADRRRRYHAADGIDYKLRLVEMNPVGAGRRNDLLHAVADFA